MSVGESEATDASTPGEDGYDAKEVRRSRFGVDAITHANRPRGLEWTIDECELADGTELPVDDTDGRQSVSLLTQQDWGTATFSGTVTVPDDVYQAVVPPSDRGSGADPPTELAIVVHSRDSVLRDAKPVASLAGPGEHEFAIDLEHDRIYGAVKLIPALVRSEPSDEPGYGTDVGKRLAAGIPAALTVDLTKSTYGLLHPKRRNFSKHHDMPPESHLVHLELDGEESPKLYLNDDYSDVLDVLDTDVDQGYDARIRDLGFDVIESQLWPQLVAAVATEVSVDGELDEQWQEDVVDAIAEPIYGEDVGLREAALQLREDCNDRAANARLQRDIEDFVQANTEVDAPTHLQALISLIRRRN
jgi:hypothetical protein